MSSLRRSTSSRAGVRRFDEDDYGEDSYEKNIFKAKPFQTGTGRRSEPLSDTVFDKPRNNWEAAADLLAPARPQPAKGTAAKQAAVRMAGADAGGAAAVNAAAAKGATGPHTAQPAEKKDLAKILTSRPKAVVKKKETPAANKPYIAKSLDGLTKGAPTIAADGLGYAEGDRVRHVKYGEGTVLNSVQDTRDFKVTVAFDEYGNKIMYAAFAKLKKV